MPDNTCRCGHQPKAHKHVAHGGTICSADGYLTCICRVYRCRFCNSTRLINHVHRTSDSWAEK